LFAVSEEMSSVVGRVFNIQRCSVHDGPGIRTTVFFKGCPLRCAWCHNPEGIDPAPALMLHQDRCLECRVCGAVCPVEDGGAAPVGESWHRDLCTRCGSCVQACPASAREMAGLEYAVDTLVDEIERDLVFFESSGGGVTFSGGEPLSQFAFLTECLEACRGRGLHTVLDTCGVAPGEQALAAARSTDLVLYDLKIIDAAKHRHATGRDNRQVLDNLRALSADGVELWIRMPLIPGVNDDRENLDRTGAFVSALPRRHPVHLLPYHGSASAKAARLGTVGETYRSPGSDELDSAVQRLQSFDLDVVIGGLP
jgi:pyruvate formate lyase activating enzyme